MVETGCCILRDSPKSPVSMPPIQRKYWTMTGLSKLYFLPNSSQASGEMP